MSARDRGREGVTRALSPMVRVGVGVVAATVLVVAALTVGGVLRDGVDGVPGGWAGLIAVIVAAVIALRALRAAIRGTITMRGR